jgi:molecular chaperone Hsp33
MNAIAKKAYRDRDRIVRAMTSDGFFRLAAIKNTKSVQAARQSHGLSPLASVLLGRAMSGASLLASFLKSEERIILEMQGSGPAQRVYAEAVQVGEVRGFVGNPHCMLDFTNPKTQLGDAVGIGVMKVSRILYGNYEPVVGIVDLVQSDVSTDLAYYLQQSEQIPSAVLLDVQLTNDGAIQQSGGLLVQAMPGAPEAAIEAMVESIRNLEKLPELYGDNFSPEEVLQMLASHELKELSNTQVDFFCRCTLDKFKASLITLGAQEIRSMKAENQRELVCRYCGKKYHLSDYDFEELLLAASAREN